MQDDLTSAHLLARGTQRLGGPARTAALDAQLLLAHVLGTSRVRLKSHPEDPVGARARADYLALIERRAAGEPLAYILGYREFWSLRLAVNPAVLVPRPETELLVERALALRPGSRGHVADLGTGSGAIALALASERPGWRIVATDRSAAALEVARRNALALGLERVELCAGDWFTPLAGRRFDLVLSNPPYVSAGDPALTAPALRFEPRDALAAGADGLLCLHALVGAAPDHLEPGGWLLLEHGSDQAAAVARALVERGFTHVRCHHDLAGHARVSEARWDR